jgi:hypothetical protein
MSQCHHAGFTDAEISDCCKCGNVKCPDCSAGRYCVECSNEISERQSAREEAALARWRAERVRP